MSKNDGNDGNDGESDGSIIKHDAGSHGGEYAWHAEYARTGQSKCKKCHKNIPEGELRMGQYSPSNIFQGLMESWYHVGCFFHSTRRRNWPTSSKHIKDFDKLNNNDQQRLEKLMGQHDSGEATVGKKATKRKFTEEVQEKVDKGIIDTNKGGSTSSGGGAGKRQKTRASGRKAKNDDEGDENDEDEGDDDEAEKSPRRSNKKSSSAANKKSPRAAKSSKGGSRKGTRSAFSGKSSARKTTATRRSRK